MVTRRIQETSFPADYSARQIDSPLDGVELREFGDAKSGSNERTCVHVLSDQGQWCGIFAGDNGWDGELSGTAHLPDPALLLVIDAGTPFVVQSATGDSVPLTGIQEPLTGILAVLSHRLLLVSSPWNVHALGVDGLAWASPRLSIETVELGHVEGDRVYGLADPDDDPQTPEFWVDLRTGEAGGGVVRALDW